MQSKTVLLLYTYTYIYYFILFSAGERQGRSPTEIVDSNLTGAWIFVCCECRVLSGRGLCDELIIRREESYRMCCVVVCDLETSRICAPYIYDISSLRVNDTDDGLGVQVK